ncbi:MAG TPA: sigma-54 dependent transcriptional regulator [Bacteroidales bacterium]|nr:sigma-54 dependent transcriptional regulator [Bacteroidales bacterium]
MNDFQAIKQRFGIIGFSPKLERAIDVARQVAPTDITVLITGESGTGKEFFPKIIHQLGSRKHGPYIAVNCGAIPEGTIDSELFGHEKGSFTGAHEARKGYFEVVNGGTIFLDEVAELPLLTQVRLLRVLETGEFIRVGSSKVQKTDVRVVGATNVNLQDAIASGRFREDLYYRLNTVPIVVPPLRERKDDIVLLFRKFASDFGEKYRMPPLQLTEDAELFLKEQRWSGNIRQLKNLAEQISVIESNRIIDAGIIMKYLPADADRSLPVLFQSPGKQSMDLSEREILYKILFDMKRDVAELKKIIGNLVETGNITEPYEGEHLIQKLSDLSNEPNVFTENIPRTKAIKPDLLDQYEEASHEEIEESLSIHEKEKALIGLALQKFRGRRKRAAEELGISERTLYRKIREYGIG